MTLSIESEAAMLFPLEKELSHLGESNGRGDHDLIHELSWRIDTLARCDVYIENAKRHPVLREFWTNLKAQEQQNIDRLKELLSEELRNDIL